MRLAFGGDAITAFAGRIAVMSLLLVSCTYRPDSASASTSALHDEPAPARQPAGEAPVTAQSLQTQVDPGGRTAGADGFTHAPRRARPLAASNAMAVAASEPAPFLGPMDETDIGETASEDDRSVEYASSYGDAARPASSSAPEAAPSRIENQAAGRAWLNPWLILPALLVAGILLLSLRRRHKEYAPTRSRRPPLMLAPVPDDNHAMPEDDSGKHDPVAPATMPSTLSWAVGKDPLAHEDWSIQLPVDYSPHLMPAAAAMLTGVATQATCTAETEAAVDLPAIAHEPVLPAIPTVQMETTEAAAPDLLARIEAMAGGDGHAPHFFLEDEGYLPVISHPEHVPPPADLLHALERTLLDHADPTGELSTWLLVQVQAWRMAAVGRNEVDALHQAAFALALHGWERASAATAPYWLARLIAVDLAQARRLSGAARLLALRNMAMRYADDIERGEGPVLKAWIGMLLYWAQHQMGDGALAHYTEAAAMAARLQSVEGMANEGQLLLAETMRHRAGVELGGVRAQTLDDAQELLDALFAREPTGRVALAVARTALARGRHATPAVAKEAFSHALSHAFLAGSDPRWQEDSLQCRLAIQLAYEALPGMPVQGRVALDLAHRLENLPAPSGDTLERMAHAFVRHEEYARACRLCAEAWRAKAATEGLLAVWRQASGQWAQRLISPGERAAWQDNERQRRVAGQMH